jgi:tRNA/rRNA methyltransferase
MRAGLLRNIGLCLVEPTFGINVGHIARLCANFGVRKLILTSPKFNFEEAKRYSMAGYKYIKGASVYESLQSAIENEKPNVVVATTSITAKRPANILRAAIDPKQFAAQISLRTQYVLLVFGRDTTGLMNREIELCDITVSINTGTRYKTMNISHAASIILYELYNAGKKQKMTSQLDRQLLERVLHMINELAHEVTLEKHRVPRLHRAMRHLLTRAQPEGRELTLLLGFLNKVRLMLRTSKRPNLNQAPSIF